jgi:hypothetical protein
MVAGCHNRRRRGRCPLRPDDNTFLGWRRAQGCAVRPLDEDPRSVEKVDGEPTPLRLHPELERARFIPRLGFRQERLAPLLAREGITMTVSQLYFVQHNPELALFARHDPPLGLALDPATHLRQVPFAQRAASFKSLPFGRSKATFDPDRSKLSENQYADLVREPLELARSRGATLLLCAYHLSGAVGSRGRTLDLRIAEDAIGHFDQEGMAEPPEHAAVNVRREIYVPIALTTAILESPQESRRLVDAYVELEADGFWVKVADLSERSRSATVRAYGNFLALLRREAERPVVADGCGHLHVGLLVNEISTSVGLAESERFAMPVDRGDRDWSGGRSRTVYHERYLRSFQADHDGAARAFEGSPCLCGRHSINVPPTGPAIEEHGAIIRAREAAAALEGEVEERREWLLATAGLASDLAHDAGVEWTKAVVFEALFGGFDHAGRDDLEETG